MITPKIAAAAIVLAAWANRIGPRQFHEWPTERQLRFAEERCGLERMDAARGIVWLVERQASLAARERSRRRRERA